MNPLVESKTFTQTTTMTVVVTAAATAATTAATVAPTTAAPTTTTSSNKSTSTTPATTMTTTTTRANEHERQSKTENCIALAGGDVYSPAGSLAIDSHAPRAWPPRWYASADDFAKQVLPLRDREGQHQWHTVFRRMSALHRNCIFSPNFVYAAAQTARGISPFSSPGPYTCGHIPARASVETGDVDHDWMCVMKKKWTVKPTVQYTIREQ